MRALPPNRTHRSWLSSLSAKKHSQPRRKERQLCLPQPGILAGFIDCVQLDPCWHPQHDASKTLTTADQTEPIAGPCHFPHLARLLIWHLAGRLQAIFKSIHIVAPQRIHQSPRPTSRGQDSEECCSVNVALTGAAVSPCTCLPKKSTQGTCLPWLCVSMTFSLPWADFNAGKFEHAKSSGAKGCIKGSRLQLCP